MFAAEDTASMFTKRECAFVMVENVHSAHDSVLYFASPFFEAIFEGDWRESNPAQLDTEDSRSASQSSTSSLYEKGVLNDTGEEVCTGAPQYRPLPSHFSSSPRASFHTARIVLDASDNKETYSEMQDTSTQQSRDPIHDSHNEGQALQANLESTDKISMSKVQENEEISAHPEQRPGSQDCDEGNYCTTQCLNSQDQTGSCIYTGKKKARNRSLSDPVPPSIQPDELISRLKRMATPPLHEKDRPHEPRPASAVDSCVMDRAEAKGDKGDLEVTAIIDLAEEDPATFQDVLCHIYPSEF